MSQAIPNIPKVIEFVNQLSHQLTRTRQKVYALDAQAALDRAGKMPSLPISFQSQHGEDLMVWDLLGGQLEGFFIEAGAFDGYHYSVTYSLEAVGWTGLLVEPLPEPAKLCALRRPNSRVINAALGGKDASGTTAFSCVEDYYGGMLSHLPGLGHVQNVSLPTTQLQVPLTNLNTLLAGHDRPIDLFVLDVEGAEIEVLEGFDLNRYQPRLIMIEADPIRSKPRLLEYMQGFPYRRAGNIYNNEVFVRNEESQIMERARWLSI